MCLRRSGRGHVTAAFGALFAACPPTFAFALRRTFAFAFRLPFAACSPRSSISRALAMTAPRYVAPADHASQLAGPDPRRCSRSTEVTVRPFRTDLGDPELRGAAGGDLREVGDTQHLEFGAQVLKARADHVGDLSADSRVDLVEDQRASRATRILAGATSGDGVLPGAPASSVRA